MSVICQTFIQNTWKKDLCSNCFKSKDEHGGEGEGGGGGGGGVKDGGQKEEDVGFSRNRNGVDGGGGGSRRYMGVAGRVYQRGYYNNSWKSIMIDKSDSTLVSTGIINGVSSLVSQENEKNLMLSDMVDSEDKNDTLLSSRLVQQVKTSQSEARLLTELLGSKNEEEKNNKEETKYKEKEEDRGDVSSDLGSEASNDGSRASSAASSACSYEVSGSAANSDTASLRSEGSSEHSSEDKPEDTESKMDAHLPGRSETREVVLVSILKHDGHSKSSRGSITFNPKLEQVIGYGGDVDYSDDEDDLDDDTDDDYDNLADLTPDERVLRQLTDKNTEFNSDNDNLKKDIEELLPSVKELEEKRKMILAEIAALEKLGRENRLKNEKAKQEEKKEDKQEAKVKLKRSPPLVSTKPLIARNNNELRINQVLPMKNGEVVRTGLAGDSEDVPLKGIKPKYVAREEEMIEKSNLENGELKTNIGKITSIDNMYVSEDTKMIRSASVHDVCISVVDKTVKTAEASQDIPAKITNIDDVLPHHEEQDISDETSDSFDSGKETLSSSSSSSLRASLSPVTPPESPPSDKANTNQNTLVNKGADSAKSCDLTKEAPRATGSDTEASPILPPVSSARKLLMDQSHHQTVNEASQQTAAKCLNTSRNSSPEIHKAQASQNLAASSKTPSPTERHKKLETSPSFSVIPGKTSSRSSSTLVHQNLNTPTNCVVEQKLDGDSRTTNERCAEEVSQSNTLPNSAAATKKNDKTSSERGSKEVSHPHTLPNSTATTRNAPKILNEKVSEELSEPHTLLSSTVATRNIAKKETENLSQSRGSGDTSEVTRTNSNQSLPVASGIPNNRALPEASNSTSHQSNSDTFQITTNKNLTESSRVTYNENSTETSKILPNQHLPEVSRKTLPNKLHLDIYKTPSNQSLQQDSLRNLSNYIHIEATKISSIQSLPDTTRTLSDHSHASRTPSNQSLPETPRSSSDQSLPETPRTLSNHSRASRTPSNQSLPETPRSSSDQSLPETPRSSESDKNIQDNAKTPASRQSSTSSMMTTFGTPLIISTPPENSFLHSSSTRSMYDDSYSCPSAMHTQETTDFLREIKLQPEVPAPTAGIQKSALYASTSCLKGLPGAKPVITPKPPKLREKPKVPYKPSGNSPRIYATPAPITPKIPIGNLSGAISTPNLTALHAGDRSDTNSTASGTSDASSSHSRPESRPENMYKLNPEQKKPPPTTQAPSIPMLNGRHKVEAVYDVPVTLASSMITTPRKTLVESSGEELKREDDATIYHEIDESIKANRQPGNIDLDQGSSGSPSEQDYSPSSSRHESTRCQSRSTFEANRSMLSAALDFGTKATRSSSTKRPAPRPPAGEEEQDCGAAEASESTTPTTTRPVERSTKSSLGESPQETTAVIPSDNNDGESYSSFTDDFDDDDDEEEEEEGGDSHPTLRKAERSSSAVPFYRNSIGAIVTHEDKGTYDFPGAVGMVSSSPLGSQVPSMVPSGSPGAVSNKPLASRSHSVPRNVNHVVSASLVSGAKLQLASSSSTSATCSSSSKFSFGRPAFLRPSSPPSEKRDSSNSDRGRDRSSKKTSSSTSSRFSLKKLLRLGGGGGGKEDERRAAKEQEKRLARDTKKGRITIIHPLDYNQNGVEVIARPEKTSPIYDYTGIYGYIPPPQLSAKLDPCSSLTQAAAAATTTIQASPAPSLASKTSHSSSSLGPCGAMTPPNAPPPPAPSLPLDAVVTTTIDTTSANVTTAVAASASLTVSGFTSVYTSSPLVTATTTSSLEKRSSFLRRECTLERQESGASYTTTTTYNGVSTSSPYSLHHQPGVSIATTTTTSTSASLHHQHHLGYNSEGRPKPPPPPRKVSLEGSQAGDIYSLLADLGHTSARPLQLQHTPTTTETPSRPQRPPPPTRTPSNPGTKPGPPRPDPPKLTKDSVYANLGDVRAPITPRKPGRTASIRGEDDREKRRAPQPPQLQPGVQEPGQQTVQRLNRHQKQDSTSSSCSSISSSRVVKGPAPARPHQPHLIYNDYETLERDDITALNITQIAVGASTCNVVSLCNTEDVYRTPRRGYQTEEITSALSSRQEKMGRLSVRRASAMTHRSLEDQYGAVISANLEALSNMLDQLCNNWFPPGYEEVHSGVSQWEDVTIDDDIIVGAGHRLFYVGEACGQEVILMLTPETKVEAHHLLTPMPLATFKDELPSHLLSHKYITRGKSTLGTVWVMPPLSLTTLRSLAEEDFPQLSHVPVEWERSTCLLLLQLVTGLKQLQAQGVEETCIDLTLVVRGSQGKGHDCDPRLILVPPTETGSPLMSLCQCAAAVTLLLMGVDDPSEHAKDGNFIIPAAVPSQRAFNILLRLLHQEKAGSLTQVKCVLEVLLFGPDSSGCDAKEGEEVEAALQRWLDLERATVLHTLIRGPLVSSVLTKFHLLFLVRTNSRILRETLKLLRDPEVTTF